MSMSANIHGATVANHNSLSDVRNDGLVFKNDDGDSVNVFVPPRVAKATAAAFNRAMQEQTEQEAALQVAAAAYRAATGAA